MPTPRAEDAIHLLDEFVVEPAQLPALRALLTERYLPGARERGLALAGEWVSPPVAIPGEPNTLWLLWRLPDVAGWWQMRFQAGADPAVAALWAELAPLCRARRRHTLVAADRALPSIAETSDDAA